jgi:Tol biopolymer transport system component
VEPKGAQIAFARVEDGRAGIYLVSPLGGSEQKLVDFSAIPISGGGGPIETQDPRLSWSADGRWLAVSRVKEGVDAGVFLVSTADGSAPRRLLAPAKPSDEYRMAVFSPTGTELALINGGFIEVVRIASTDPPAVSGTPRRVSPFLGFVSGLAWTADANELVFGRSRYASPDPPSLWRVLSSGDRAPERIDLAGVAGYPVVSALGNRLAFVRRGINEDLLLLREGQLPEPLLASTSNEQDPSFSADGSKIAFATDRNGEGHEIWVAQTADASTRHPVTRGAHRPEGSPRWSPDGRRLAFDGLADDGVRHVYIVDEAGGPIQTVPIKAGSFDQIPSWSHDGRWIYFGSNRSGRVEVWRAPANGGNAEQVTTTGGNAPLESLDRRTIYYFRTIDGLSTVFAMPVGGGREQPLGITTSFWNYVPTREGLCYVSTGKGQRALSSRCDASIPPRARAG